MKKSSKPWSTIAMLFALAIGMVAVIVVLLKVNPADKPVNELIPVVIMCAAIALACLGFNVYFLIPVKDRSGEILAALLPKTINTAGEYWTGEAADDIKEYLKVYSSREETLYEGQSTKAGGIVYAAKVCLFIVLIFEVIFAAIALFWDIGLADKPKTFLVLQACLIMPVVIFVLMCFQIMGAGDSRGQILTGFRYKITNERVYINYGNSNTVVYNISDIANIKIKYAFHERHKLAGTVKVKLRKRRIAPHRCHLYSIPDPEEAFGILQDLMNNPPKESGYTAKIFEEQKCGKCGEEVFSVQGNPDEQLYRIICKGCNEAIYIADSGDLWVGEKSADEYEHDDEDTTEPENGVMKFNCQGLLGHGTMHITLGYALREDGSKSRLYIGYLCDECKILGCMDDIEIV